MSTQNLSSAAFVLSVFSTIEGKLKVMSKEVSQQPCQLSGPTVTVSSEAIIAAIAAHTQATEASVCARVLTAPSPTLSAPKQRKSDDCAMLSETLPNELTSDH